MPGPVPPPLNPSVTPKVTMLTLYAGLCFGAVVIIVVAGWPHPWVALALLPLVVGVLVFRRAVRAAREAHDRWLAEDD